MWRSSPIRGYPGHLHSADGWSQQQETQHLQHPTQLQGSAFRQGKQALGVKWAAEGDAGRQEQTRNYLVFLIASPEFIFATSQCLSCPKSLSDKPSLVGITLCWISSKNLEWNWLLSLYSVSLGCGSGPKGLKQNAVGLQREKDEVSVP